MNNCEIRQLAMDACRIRMGVIEATFNAKSGHPGGSLSIADLMAYLYSREIRCDVNNPKWEDRDRFVLSKGHAAPGLYSALAVKGFFPVEDLKQLRHTDSYLQGHPNLNSVPGVDMSTGSLGQGISAACGMAKAAKYLGKDTRVYAVLGDGELAEGQVWESAMFAAHYKLDNLCVFVDLNGLQIDGPTSQVMNTAPVDEKFRAFGFNVIVINGHDFNEIEAALDNFHKNEGCPTCVIMKTTKGKGVSFMENNVGWHGKAPNQQEYEQAMQELNAALAELEASK